MFKKIPFYVFIVPILFFVISFLTLGHYGINWDEPFHFARGHAILRFLLTGKTNYLDLPAYSPKPKGESDFMDQFGEEMKAYVDAPKSEVKPDQNVRRSFFQSDVWTYQYLLDNYKYGHPGVNDLLAAGFNYLFYQKLNILGDIESYHFFEIFCSSLLVFLLSVFAYKKFGGVTSVVSGIVLSSYPIFFSESHFNIKDPVMTSFIGITIILFCWGIDDTDWKKIIYSSIFFALALGTKLNILFMVPILFIYALVYVKKIFSNKSLLISLLLFPFVSTLIFYLLSPNIWTDTIERLKIILLFYKDIGLGTQPELAAYIWNKINLFAPMWISITTQIPYLVLALIGLIFSIYKLIKSRDVIYFVVLCWFLIPVVRVLLPNTNIYGGVRQIMEFVPAMALLAGIGAKFLYDKFNKTFVVSTLIFFLSFSVFEMILIHPNENLYFNQIIGGLSGAKDKQIPYWGNSYGNVYLQGVNWLNENAPLNSRLALPIGTPYQIPRLKLRKDIAFSNSYLSGDKHEGEYVMENYFDWSPMLWYRYAYFDTFFNPVYELKVDGVTVFKIWHNTKDDMKNEFKEESIYKAKSLNLKVDEIEPNLYSKKIIVDLGKTVNLTKMRVSHSSTQCDKQKPGYGYIALSQDQKNWTQEIEPINTPQIYMEKEDYGDDAFTYWFAAKKARYILLDSQIANPCILKNPQIQIWGLKQTI